VGAAYVVGAVQKRFIHFHCVGEWASCRGTSSLCDCTLCSPLKTCKMEVSLRSVFMSWSLSALFTGGIGGHAQGCDCTAGLAAGLLQRSALESDRAQEKEHACQGSRLCFAPVNGCHSLSRLDPRVRRLLIFVKFLYELEYAYCLFVFYKCLLFIIPSTVLFLLLLSCHRRACGTRLWTWFLSRFKALSRSCSPQTAWAL